MNIPVYVGISDKLKNIRCIKAARDIKKGELIERCPVIFVPDTQCDDLEKTSLSHYYYCWNDEKHAVVLGYCVLTNHSYTPNAEFKKNIKNKTMDYYALKDIKKDEEILINYNQEKKKILA
jgi:SET domain-containing protein